MKITKHISFYFLLDRLCYINRIIDETYNYEYITDIFIHTNLVSLDINMFNKYTNGILNIIYHDLTNINPFYLTWKCRDLLKQQKDDYDIFMYIEDDILVPCNAIKYWLKYNKDLIDIQYNLGFVRIEIKDNIEYITDLTTPLDLDLDSIINLNETTYCINNKNPYCAFWIYNKEEFTKFINSKYYDISNIINYGIRESSAIGLHGISTNWYLNTVIPYMNNKLIDDCKIYHMPNNYATDNNTPFAKIKFDNAIM